MVRVYNCHPFAAQLIVPVQHEPDTLCCGRDTLFVVSAGCKIEAFSVTESGCQPICTFNALGKVQKITFSEIACYLVAIEEKSNVLSLRVYFNWKGCQAQGKSRVGVRIVGHMLQAPFEGAPKDQMEIIEVPLSEPPVSVSCCPIKGDLVVGCHNKVVFFRLKEVALAGQSPVFDFERFLVVHVGLKLLEVAFCNGCLAMIADLEVLVLKLERARQVENTAEQQVGRKAAPVNKATDRESNDTGEASLSQGQDEFVFFQRPLELLGEDTWGSGVVVNLEWTGAESLTTEQHNNLYLRRILYRRFAPDLAHIYSVEETALHSLQLLPMFATGDSESAAGSGRKDKQVLSLFCFFSLPHVGCLYAVGNMVQQLSTYNYPEKAKQAVISPQFLHVITRLDRTSSQMNCCNQFGAIYSWIHTINASHSHPHGPSDDLLKLQSILCGSFIDVKSVLPLLHQLPEDDGPGLSVHVLCATRLGECEHVTDQLLDRCPEALLPFASCEMRQEKQPLWWKKLLPELCRRTKGAGGENRILVSSLKETLAVVATILQPLDFLSILPDEGIASFFLPHLQECSRKNFVT
ncbi:Hermansky-Pudlak syndrome 3 protein [Rhincodon typus]|uniref:Hermansky-Pudlak syndrome 3 protein n=1 Tax=Rhincodon typus TaxID=259920 RepID=UPI00202E01F1|nr:Hermansky-Pudlak syndrome 3 protein [Rhincodon typus]